MASEKPQPSPTAMGLLAMMPPKKKLQEGLYTVEYQGFELRHSKSENRPYYLHTFKVLDQKFDGELVHMCTSTELKRSDNPKYHSKLYKLVSALMEHDLDYTEKLDLRTLKSKKCKVILETNTGIETVVCVFRETAIVANLFGEWQEAK